MELSTDLHCLYTAEVSENDRNGAYTLTVPEAEVQQGSVTSGDAYRIAILSLESGVTDNPDETDGASESTGATTQSQTPPVSEGEKRDVEIESLGDQGDGIAKVERGFVVIVPDTDVGERVTVEIADVGSNVAFAEVVDRHHEI